MKSFDNGFGNVSPQELLYEGESWLALWEHARHHDRILFPAIYCLFSALEFYLKAYIVLKDNTYADTQRLRQELGHNFNSLYAKVSGLTDDNKFSLQLKSQLKKYRLLDLGLDTLKYPESGRLWAMNSDLVKGIHSLESIFQKIKVAVDQGNEAWLQTKYPKKLEQSLLFQFDFEGDPNVLTRQQTRQLINTCEACLPIGVMVTEHYNFPWHENPIPARTCVVCAGWFMPRPRSMRMREQK